ncbi:hypothetical protein DP20_3065 [Shigella flexneri]|nr:hypothetical protein DP20_3065 [Shigella flexneri]
MSPRLFTHCLSLTRDKVVFSIHISQACLVLTTFSANPVTCNTVLRVIDKET